MCFWYCWMCAGRFGLDFYPWYNLIFARRMFMHFSCIRFFFLPFYLCYLVVMCFLSLSLSLSISLSLSLIDCAMVPKACKSTPAWNPLGSGSSSSNPIPSLHVWFRDEKAWKDFLENSQKHGIHLKCHVILLDFSDTSLPFVIRTRG